MIAYFADVKRKKNEHGRNKEWTYSNMDYIYVNVLLSEISQSQS